MRFSKHDFDILVRKFFPIHEQFVDTDEEETTLVNSTEFESFRGSVDDLDFWEETMEPYIMECLSKKVQVGTLPNDLIMKKIIQLKIINKTKVDWKLITLCPRARMNLDLVPTVKDFCEDFFDKECSKYFEEIHYVVECGKKESDPNVHVHFVCKPYQDWSHNFRRNLLKKWNFYFAEDYNIGYKIKKGKVNGKMNYNEGIDIFHIRTEGILLDKIRYLFNENKGTHKNFKDLGIYKHIKYEG